MYASARQFRLAVRDGARGWAIKETTNMVALDFALTDLTNWRICDIMVNVIEGFFLNWKVPTFDWIEAGLRVFPNQ